MEYSLKYCIYPLTPAFPSNAKSPQRTGTSLEEASVTKPWDLQRLPRMSSLNSSQHMDLCSSG